MAKAKSQLSASLLVLLAMVVVLPYIAFVQIHHYPPSSLLHLGDAGVSGSVGGGAAAVTFTTAPPRAARDAGLAATSADFLRVITEARASVDLSRSHLDGAVALGSTTTPGHAQLGSSATTMRPGEATSEVIQPDAVSTMPSGATPSTMPPPVHVVMPGGQASPGGGSAVDLVVGLGTGITPENLAVFAGSLRRVNPAAALVLYLDAPLPKTHQVIVDKFNVTSIEFSVQLLSPAFLRKYHPSNYRWPLLYRYLREHSGIYRKVLMADVRDTLFQEDPFARFGSGFFTFNGVESRTIGQCGWNGGWVKDCFGEAMFQRLSKKRIICSGISMGSAVEVEAYLKLMSETMETAEFAKCERNGVDQGVHNVLVHTGQIPGLVVRDQRTGWVANMQSGLSRVTKGGVLNQKGERVSVVHQYDRYKELQAGYFKDFVFWPMPSEAETCADFTIARGQELFKKTCDLKVTSGHSTGHCCVACQRMGKCQAFSFVGSQCFLKSCTGPRRSIVMESVTSGFLTHP